MVCKRLVAVLAMFFGLLGLAACIAGFYAVWLAGSRLDRANDRVFATIDKSLVAARDRLLRGQQRVQESRLTSDEIGKLLRDWTAKQAAERIVSRLEIEGKTDKLAQKLQQANLLLETANESIEGAQQVLEAAHSLGAPVDAALVEEVRGRLASLQSTMHQALETVDRVRESIAKADDVASAEERISRAIRLATRVIVAISEIDTRLGELANRLSELQASAGQFKGRTSEYIAGGTIVSFLLVAWIAAGQATLCLYGRNKWRRSQEQITTSSGSHSQSPAG